MTDLKLIHTRFNVELTTCIPGITHLDYKVQYCGEDSSEPNWPRDKWLCTLYGVTVTYYTGLGHRVPRKQYYKYEPIKEGTLKAPTFDDVLSCILRDAELGAETFKDFCDSVGYDTDSRKALKTYLECQETIHKVQSIAQMMKHTAAKLNEIYSEY